MDYLNNDFAPNLIKFMQSKISGRKNSSYYGFLQAVGEEDLPAFDERQEGFVKYASELLPIVRPHEYLIMQSLIENAGKQSLFELERYIKTNTGQVEHAELEHAIKYMVISGFFALEGTDLLLHDVNLNVELDEYMRDLLEYGLGHFDVDYGNMEGDEIFRPWAKYRKAQVQQLLLNNPGDIMLGTKIYDDVVYIYVTIVKASGTKEDLKYVDGYLDPDTFQWETVAHIREAELKALKRSQEVHAFVRKVDQEDGIQLPFTYIGRGHMEYVEGSKKANGAHLFRIPMDLTAPEDIYFDFKLPD